jgi:hypothetical protein
MISICIPIYNLDVNLLVKNLSEQIKNANYSCEIILIDDASANAFLKLNEKTCNKEIYIKLSKNIGRSKIRNRFLEYVNYQNLLFLDCDSTIISDNYLNHYIDRINSNKKFNVIFGGSVYAKEKPKRNKVLRWKYGRLKESQCTKENNFMTNNFLIKKEVFKKVRFDERLTKYGHEDTLFGYELVKNGYKIEQYKNEVLNGNLETNKEYLNKTETSIKSLVKIVSYVNNDKDFINHITLLKFHKKIKEKGFSNLILVLFTITKPFLKFCFTNGFINLFLFDFYKLGFFIKESKKQ